MSVMPMFGVLSAFSCILLLSRCCALCIFYIYRFILELDPFLLQLSMQCIVNHCLSFFVYILSLQCLPFFDLRLLVTTSQTFLNPVLYFHSNSLKTTSLVLMQSKCNQSIVKIALRNMPLRTHGKYDFTIRTIYYANAIINYIVISRLLLFNYATGVCYI